MMVKSHLSLKQMRVCVCYDIAFFFLFDALLLNIFTSV